MRGKMKHSNNRLAPKKELKVPIQGKTREVCLTPAELMRYDGK